MVFVDEMTIYAKAGDGGDGVVRWHREKFRPLGGPAGGDGGKGGDVYLKAVKNLGLLAKYTGDNKFVALDGEPGGKGGRHGRASADTYINLPVGSLVTDCDRRLPYELDTPGQTELVLHGGVGGRGNKHFKSSVNRSPDKATKGKPGEAGSFQVELRLTAEAGLVGLPNAGKSTLLNLLTNAKSAVGAYQFTTREPHLGDCEGHIIADIPGLIEGAAEGRGLGHKFLKHIQKTKMLLHLVSLESDDLESDYKQIRKELTDFDPHLGEREEWIVITKADLKTPAETEKIKATLAKLSDKVFAITQDDAAIIKSFREALLKHLSGDA